MTIFGKKFDRAVKKIGGKVVGGVARIGSKVYKGSRKFLNSADPYLDLGAGILGGAVGAFYGGPMGAMEGFKLGKTAYNTAKMGAQVFDTGQRLIGDAIKGKKVNINKLTNDVIGLGQTGMKVYSGGKGVNSQYAKNFANKGIYNATGALPYFY